MQVKKEPRFEKKKKSLVQGCLAAAITQATSYYQE